MSINNLLTKHADALRAKTGVTDKLSISEKWGQFNLLEGTSNQYRNVNIDTPSGEYWHTMTTASGGTTPITSESMKHNQSPIGFPVGLFCVSLQNHDKMHR